MRTKLTPNQLLYYLFCGAFFVMPFGTTPFTVLGLCILLVWFVTGQFIKTRSQYMEAPWFWPVVAGGLFIILALLVLVVGRYTFLKEEAEVEIVEVEVEPQVAAPVEEPAALPEAPLQGAPLVDLDYFLVPLDMPDRTVLRVSISLELASASSRAGVLRKTTLVRDIIFRVLEMRGQGDLKSKEARQTMRQRIKQEVNLKLEGGPVLNVYFTEFLVL